MRLLYLVHDLRDPATERRLQMLQDAGVEPSLLGFRRGPAVATVAGVMPVDMGRTENGRLGRRVCSVMRAALSLRRWEGDFGTATVLVARNLEMLLLAAIARRRFAPKAALVYECLDVHMTLVGTGWKQRLLRSLEGALLRRCQLLIVSSPAFVAQHFRPNYRSGPPVALLENKPLSHELPATDAPRLAGAAPWRIGWFGMIRCRRSLMLLAALVRSRPGQVEVVIRGRPARDVLPEFDDVIAMTPGMSFLGAYDRSRDLAAIYGEVHFAWAMDFYEAGANSTWLLPNRLYEGASHGAVPIALSGVQTGAWLETRGAGIVLAEPLQLSLAALVDGLDEAGYAAARSALAAVPAACLVAGPEESAQLASRLAAVSLAASPKVAVNAA